MNYVVSLTSKEADALAWVAARYETAAILWAHCEPSNDDYISGKYIEATEHVITLPEHEAWRYLEELSAENGFDGQILPTCVGGTLGEKLIELWESIV